MGSYKRNIQRLSAAFLILACMIRVVTVTGLDLKIGQAVKRAVRSPELASFLLYLELGRVTSLSASDTLPPQEPEMPEAPEETEHPPEDPGQGPEEPADAPEQEAPDLPAEPADPKIPPEQQAGSDPASDPTPDPQPAETEDGPLQFTQADADGIAVGGKCTYSVDTLALLQQETRLDFDQEGPTVLIVHTHTSEAYTQEAGWEYEENDTARTQDPNYSVIRVGNELAETLENHGISVLHDTSFNDYPSYNGAYNRTLAKIEDWVELYPSIQMVIDVHRDAAADADGNPVSHTAEINGEPTAKLMLVMGTDEGGLSHPNWRENLSWGLKLQAVLNRMYPGLCRNLDLRTERFNQHVTAGSMLVEVGSSGNTLKQALAAARDLGEGLAALIAGS